MIWRNTTTPVHSTVDRPGVCAAIPFGGPLTGSGRWSDKPFERRPAVSVTSERVSYRTWERLYRLRSTTFLARRLLAVQAGTDRAALMEVLF
jgi:hypothetical protein